MDARGRLLGPCATRIKADEPPIRFDLGAFVRRLILFDTFILESHGLREFPYLVRLLGYDGVKEILDAGLLRVKCDWVVVGSSGQAAVLASRVRKGLLPLGSFAFDIAKAHADSPNAGMIDHKGYVHLRFSEIADEWDLNHKRTQKIKKAIGDRILAPPADIGEPGLAQFRADVRDGNPVIAQSIVSALAAVTGIRLDPAELAVRAEFIDDRDFRVETELSRFGLDKKTEHRVLEKGLMGAAALDVRLELMRRHEAVTGWLPGDVALFDARLAFLGAQLDPLAQEERFDRVLNLAGLPEVDADTGAGIVDAARLVEIVQSEECRTFREWLRNVDSATDTELEEHFGSLKEKFSTAVHSRAGKAVRFVVTSGVGAIPGIGQAVGAAASVIDSFLIDRFVSRPGPTAFLSHLYPSIFRRSDPFGTAGP